MNIYRYKSTGKLYEVISENARMKDPTFDRWLDCVIYRPLDDNKYEMFSRWSVEFYDKFEALNKELTEEELEEQRKIRQEIRERWEKIGLTSEMQDKLEEYTKYVMGEAKKEDGEIKWPTIERVFIDFNKEYKIPEKTVAEKIDQLWHEYYRCCEGCVGNGCDDCRSCEESKKKSEIYNKIQNLKNEN